MGAATEETEGASTRVGGSAGGVGEAGCDGGVDSEGVLQEAVKKRTAM